MSIHFSNVCFHAFNDLIYNLCPDENFSSGDYGSSLQLGREAEEGPESCCSKLKRSVINIFSSWSKYVQFSAGLLRTMFSCCNTILSWSKCNLKQIQIPCISDQNKGISWKKASNTMISRSTNSNLEVKRNICQDDSYLIHSWWSDFEWKRSTVLQIFPDHSRFASELIEDNSLMQTYSKM